MLYVTVAVTIRQPIERVFSFVADVASHVSWQGTISEARLEPPGPIQVGSIFHYVAEFDGRRTESGMRVARYEPCHVLVLETTNVPAPMETTYLFEPVTGGTRLNIRAHLTGGFPALAQAMVRKQLEITLQAQATRIKALLE